MTTATLDSPLMTAKQVGQILGEDPETVLVLVRNGEIGCIRRNARSIRFAQGHVNEYLAKYEVPATATVKAERPARNPRRTK